MTPICSTRIDHPMAWHGRDFSKEDIAFDLTSRHVSALEDVLLKVRRADLPLSQIFAGHCRHPALDRDLERIFDEIREFETRLEPGEASFLNNYTVMHARSEFDDWEKPDKKRLMLRLWLDVERKGRPVVRQIHIYENVGGRSGIDPQPGRLPAVAKYRAPDGEARRQASPA